MKRPSDSLGHDSRPEVGAKPCVSAGEVPLRLPWDGTIER